MFLNICKLYANIYTQYKHLLYKGIYCTTYDQGQNSAPYKNHIKETMHLTGAF